MHNYLREVNPIKGDNVWIRHLGDGCTLRPGKLQEQTGQGFHKATFLGRFVDIRIEPAWDMQWSDGIEYLECVPEPCEGDRVHKRNIDAHSWEVWMALRAISLDVGQVTFDQFHLVVGRYGDDRKGYVFTRLWVRWCYSGSAFVPVQNPEIITKLNKQLPR